MKTAPQSSLALHNLALDVCLGWPDHERAQLQTVWLDVHLRFQATPKACFSDALEDTYCYDDLVKRIKAHLHHQTFRLLENITQVIYQFLKENLPEALVTVRVKKHPQIDNLQGGVSFFFGDEALTW